MKSAIISLFRLVMLVGVLILLPHLTKTHAQAGGGNCQKFGETEYTPCASCCTSKANAKGSEDPPFSSGAGTQSLQTVNWSCGSPQAGCSVACSGPSVQAVPDGSCCISSGGSGCSNTGEPCCSGSSCESGTCVTSTGSGDGGDCGGHKSGSGGCNPSSPILVDVAGKGFYLTNATDGVLFDISGSGNPIQMGWTARGAQNAFLALPGADGLVHNGTQLFGNFTQQPDSPNPNGFAALAVYDQLPNGGNGNGIIDSGDSIYSYLRLWIDENHDGIAQLEELHTLSSLGVESISLNYKLSKREDQYGNMFRYKTAVDPNDPDPAHVGRTAYDVFFVSLSSSATP
jgi:hypothetical protein